MSLAANREATSGVVVHAFSGRSAAAATDAPPSDEDRAALEQFSLERVMAYGVHHADAVELRGRVAAGEGWQSVAAALAEDCLAPPERSVATASPATEANRFYRASALLRMSQIIMLSDDEERRKIFARAAGLYGQAAALTGDREKTIINTEGVTLAGGIHPSQHRKT